MKARILFVDDEPNVIDGLRRMLHPQRHCWEMHFVTDGPAALQALEQNPFDLIVSDMRMPGMDGAELLQVIERLYPQVVRIVLSGTAALPEALHAMRPIHQYLAKPCDTDTVKKTIDRTLRLSRLVPQPVARRLVAKNNSVPSLPSLYAEIIRELNSPDCSILRVADIIARDAGMTAKILQVANSALFSLRGEVATASEAIFRLGLDVVKALALSVQVFSSFGSQDVKSLNLERVWPHSLATAVLARRIAQNTNASPQQLDMTFTAGLLHDVGKLVLATNVSAEYAGVLDDAARRQRSDWLCEREAFEVSHAEIGAYLIGLWGLPDVMVEAVAYHHRPSAADERRSSPLAAVHFANVLDHHRGLEGGRDASWDLDLDYLAGVGLEAESKDPSAFLSRIGNL